MRVLAIVACLMLAAVVSAADAVSIVCVGDSITFGDKIEHGQDTYPQALEHLFNGAASVTNAGHNGASATKTSDLPYWSTKEFAAAKEAAPAVVVIMLGTNDSRQKDWTTRKDVYAQDLNRNPAIARLPLKQKP